ncbi:hypothetical protein HBB16_21830 [Pseudonocardia sp. MCCB 268]|nr:hypothetical protein [Pseudonocardia cytotoxica]
MPAPGLTPAGPRRQHPSHRAGRGAEADLIRRLLVPRPRHLRRAVADRADRGPADRGRSNAARWGQFQT